jgi:drug/metabolite transporter (DMT)-like permease
MTASSEPKRLWLGYGALAASMALVGSYVALSKPLVAIMPVFLLAWLRYLIGAAAMLHWLPRPADEPPLTAHTHAWLFLQALLGNFLFTLCMLYGVRLTTASAAGVIMASIPAVVALLSAVLLRERLDARAAVGIALAALGIGLFALDKGPGNAAATGDNTPHWMGLPLPFWGNALVFGAVVCEASYVVIGKRLSGRLSARRIAALINAWGLLLMTPFGLWSAWHFDWQLMTPAAWALLVFYGLAASVWTVWLWMTGLRDVPAARAGVFTVMLPISAAAIGVLFMGEVLSLRQWGAFALALLGLLAATLPRLPFTRTKDPSAA